jgi:predicted RNA binding protein YcfA (HicA-like mRNA interferase family)
MGKADKKVKREEKQAKKQEREHIINVYMNKILSKLDDDYLESIEIIDGLNNELMQRTIEFQAIEDEVKKAIRNNEPAESIINMIDIISKHNENFINTLRFKDLLVKELTQMLPSVAKNVMAVLEEAKTELNNNKNSNYILSIIQNQSLKKIDEYNQFIIYGFFKDNPYMEMYVHARNSFVEFSTNVLEELNEEDVDVYTEEIEGIEVKKVKFTQRLRCTYNELQDFARSRGYEDNRQGNTTHAIWKNTETGKSMPIPNKSGTIPQGTMSRILKQMDLNRADLANFLYN